MSPRAWFIFQNTTYIFAFAVLAAEVLTESSRRRLHRNDKACDISEVRPPALTQRLRQLLLLTCAGRFIIAYVLIFGDSEGGGQMFTYEGVLMLFRSKGDGWVVGLWMELCTLFVLAAIWMVDDDRAKPHGRCMGLHGLLACLTLTFFVAGFGFVAYMLLRGSSDGEHAEGGNSSTVVAAAKHPQSARRARSPASGIHQVRAPKKGLNQ